MSEIEIHAHHHPDDPQARRVGILVGAIGILLSGATISSHRAHTDAVIHRTEANDQWTYFQAKKTRQYIGDVGASLLSASATGSAPVPQLEAALRELQSAHARYGQDADAIEKKARAKDAETEHSETRALRFDLGEGMLELGLVLCSLYFLARKKFFTTFGMVAAALGTVVAASGYLV